MAQPNMIRCRTCQERKLPGEFYYGRRICKRCVCETVVKHRRKNSSVQDYDRERSKRPAKKAKIAACSKAWRKKHPDRYKAQNALNNGLKDGKIKKGPCAVCGTAERVHAHHHDYSKPLDVTWLCALHHHRLHADGVHAT